MGVVIMTLHNSWKWVVLTKLQWVARPIVKHPFLYNVHKELALKKTHPSCLGNHVMSPSSMGNTWFPQLWKLITSSCDLWLKFFTLQNCNPRWYLSNIVSMFLSKVNWPYFLCFNDHESNYQFDSWTFFNLLTFIS